MGSKKQKRSIKLKATDNLAAREDLAKHFDTLADQSTENLRGYLMDAVRGVDKGGGDEETISASILNALAELYERRGYRNAATDIRESAEKA